MADGRAAVTIAYEPAGPGGERFSVTCSSEASHDEYTLEALGATATVSIRNTIANALALYGAADKQIAEEKDSPE